MSFAEFHASLARDSAPVGLSPVLQALWHAGRGDWDAAHTCAQADSSREGAWVHAYLHREEGDLGNAGYWYARARRPMPVATMGRKEEWSEIVRALLGSGEDQTG